MFDELANKEDGTGVSRVSAVELATGKVTRLQEWPQMVMQRMLAIAPDGKSIVLEELKDGSAGCYDLETGKRVQRYGSPKDKPVGSLHVSPDGKQMASINISRRMRGMEEKMKNLPQDAGGSTLEGCATQLDGGATPGCAPSGHACYQVAGQ